MTEEEIFVTAIEIEDHTQRREYLDDACAGDASLRAAVDELVSVHETAGDFLETPALASRSDFEEESAGTLIGRYRLIERIGEGGFGDVWKAEQHEPVSRLVALKVIKPGMDTRRVIARFETERQVLAMMNHPHIAAVLDAGSTDRGRPYFVMELVDGLAIDEFCDSASMSIRERLELFARICRAVQHAHQKGIVHRDLKPSNILVRQTDGAPDPKIIDFGIAKAMQNPVGCELSATASHQFMGTPEYMSPEQISGDGDIDTRADVYALGGVLYKLLTGVVPLDAQSLRKSGLAELSRAICEVDPQRPSSRVARLDNAQAVAALRRTHPQPLRKTLSGDLDAIAAKALEKDRSRRYESASEFARDVERFLAHEPVLAAAPGVLNRTAKFVRRNRLPVLAVAAVCLGVLSVAVVATASLFRLQEEQEKTLAEWHRAEEQKLQVQREREEVERQRQKAIGAADREAKFAQMLERLLNAPAAENGKPAETNMREYLDEFATSLESELHGYPEIEARVRNTVGGLYKNFREWEKAGRHLQRVLEIHEREFGPDDARTIRSRLAWASCLLSRSDLDGAEEQVEQALLKLRAGEPSDDLLEGLTVLSRIRRVQGEMRKCEQLISEGWKVSRELYGEEHPISLAYQGRMAFRLLNEGKVDEALQLTTDALAGIESIRGSEHMEVASARYFHARMLLSAGDTDGAFEMIRAALKVHRRVGGEHSTFVISDLVTLAKIHLAVDQFDEALQTAREAVAACEVDNTELDAVRFHAYALLRQLSVKVDPEEAARVWEQKIAAKRRLLANHSLVLDLHGLGFLCRRLGRWDEAEQHYREAASLRREADATRGLSHTLQDLAELQTEAGRFAAAAATLQEALAVVESPSQILLINHFQALIDAGRFAEAHARADWLDADAAPREHMWQKTAARVARAQLLMTEGNFVAAEKQLLQTLDDLIAHKAVPRLITYAGFVWVDCLIPLKHFRRAEAALLRTEKGMYTRGFREADRRRVHLELVALYEAWDKPDDIARWKARLTPGPDD